MLLRFQFRNHRSFRDEQDFSMIAGNYREHEDVVRRVETFHEGVLPVAAVYGANASGKSNMLKALEFLRSAVLRSHRDWKPDGGVPRDRFMGASQGDTASEYVVDFLLDGIQYQFGFSADSEVIQSEWLHAYPSRRRQVWYERKAGAKMTFGPNMSGAKRSIEALTRTNSLFLSAAVQNANELVEPIYRWLTRSLTITRVGMKSMPVPRSTISTLQQDRDFKDAFLALVKGADFGIEQMRMVEESPKPETVEYAGRVAAAMPLLSPDAKVPDLPSTRPELRFMHRGGQEFQGNQESDGTRSYIALLGPALKALRSGGTVCVDELDSSLHPHLAVKIVRLFQEKESNPKDAQLIFNTHDTNLLSHAGLRRDQIWFCEKASDGATAIYPLSDFKPRKEENLETGYLQGRYGAIPFLNEGAFTAALGGADAEA